MRNEILRTGSPSLESEQSEDIISLEEALEQIDNPENFYDIDKIVDQVDQTQHVDLAKAIIAAGNIEILSSNLRHFSGLNQEIAEALLDYGKGPIAAELVGNFQGLDQSIFMKYADIGKAEVIMDNLSSFQELDYDKIAYKLIDLRRTDLFLDKPEIFSQIDSSNYKNIAIGMIRKGDGFKLAENIDRFLGLDNSEIVREIDKYDIIHAVGINLEKFNNLDKRAAELLINQFASKVVEFLDRFKADEQMAIIEQLISSGYGRHVLEGHIDSLSHLNPKDIHREFVKAKEELMAEEWAERIPEFMPGDLHNRVGKI